MQAGMLGKFTLFIINLKFKTMKKLFLLSIAMLIGMSFSFAQYELIVTWNAESVNCTCGAGIDSTFNITILIRDTANENEFDPIYTSADGSTNSKSIDAGFIEDYCEEYHDYTPVFYIRATVVLHCDDNPPFDSCDNTVNHGPESCYSFSQDDIDVDVGNLN